MRGFLRRLCAGEEGTAALLFALAMSAIMGLAALGADVGRLYVERTRLSTLADAAALSGAQYLPGNPDQALATARSYLQKNGVDPSTASIAITENQRELDVQISRSLDMTFAKVIGRDSVVINGDAAAWTLNVSGFYGAAPLGVARADWKLGDQVYLKMDAETGPIAPGNYQALALGRSGASMYEHNLTYGYQGWIRVDQWIETETGNMAGPTVRAVNYRINQDPYATFASHSRRSPRLVVVPILEDFNVNGRGEVHVVGFGMFFLEQAYDHGNNKGGIVGRFVKFLAEGEGSAAVPDFGLYTTKLRY